MPKKEQRYRDGDVIFREGDPSDAAYIVLEGKVQLTKAGENGPIPLALLRKGEMFGEMGIIDHCPRSATAHGAGRVLVQVVPKDQFMDVLESEPKLAVAIIRKLTQRLRAADELLVQRVEREPEPKPVKARVRSNRPGLFSRLLRGEATTKTERIEIRLAPIPLPGEVTPELMKMMAAVFEKRKTVHVRILNKPLEAVQNADMSMPAAMAVAARRVLAENDGDLLIWGTVPEMGETLHLRFVSAADEDGDRPGLFNPVNILPLPLEFSPDYDELLCAIAFAATIPRTDFKAAILREALAESVEAATALVGDLPRSLTVRERASIGVCFGNAVSSLGHQRGTPELFQSAVKIYQTAISSLSLRDSKVEWVLAQKQLGTVLHAIAERANDTEAHRAAEKVLRKSLEAIDKYEFPREWAAMQNRLGEILYWLDLQSSEGDLLKEALTAFQISLQVFNKTDTPMQWAEVMNNIGQAAQIMGQQLRDPDILERAADACRAALDIRTKNSVPLLWAASQNNLGSALFLLGRMTNDFDILQSAADAFGAAKDVYASVGGERMVGVTEKNLAHVTRLLEEKRPREGPKMWWEDEDGGEAAIPSETAAGRRRPKRGGVSGT